MGSLIRLEVTVKFAGHSSLKPGWQAATSGEGRGDPREKQAVALLVGSELLINLLVARAHRAS